MYMFSMFMDSICICVILEHYLQDDVCLYVGHVCGKLGLHNWSICVSCLVGL